MPFGAANCPACGRPLWYLTIDRALTFFRHADAPLVWKFFAALAEDQRLPSHPSPDTLDSFELVAEFKAALADAGQALL